MQYEPMFSIAQDVAMRQQQSGAYITPDDTICVICSVSQKIYVGVSRVEVRNGQPINLHAEIVAWQQMQAGGENAAASLLLVNAVTCRPMLPCNGCIQYFVTRNPNNLQCQVVLPDRTIPLGEIGKPAGGSMPFQAAPGNSMYMNSGSVPFNSAMPYGSMPMQSSVYLSASMSMPYGGAAPAGTSGYSQSSSQMSQPYGSPNPNPNLNPAAGGYMGASLPSGAQKSKNSNADYLKNRVGSLMQVAEDDDDDEPPEKGLFGRLFRK